MLPKPARKVYMQTLVCLTCGLDVMAVSVSWVSGKEQSLAVAHLFWVVKLDSVSQANILLLVCFTQPHAQLQHTTSKSSAFMHHDSVSLGMPNPLPTNRSHPPCKMTSWEF